MSLCFLVGFTNKENCSPAVRILRSIEYLRYEFSVPQVVIKNDFIVYNPSKSVARLRCLHRGNIVFRPYNGNWFTEPYWTAAMEKYAASSIGLEINKVGSASIQLSNSQKIDNIEYLMDSDTQKINLVLNQELPSDVFAPFTLVESPEIQPGKACVYRLEGIAKDKTYNQLLEPFLLNGVLEVNGGYPLLREIKEELNTYISFDHKDAYIEAIRKFEQLNMTTPERYDVFLEESRKRSFEYFDLSTDVKPCMQNIYYQNRCISWYRSKTPFILPIFPKNDETHAPFFINGPELQMMLS